MCLCHPIPPCCSVLLQHPNITASYKTCVVRVLSANGGQLTATERDAAAGVPRDSSGGSAGSGVAGGSKGPTGGRVVQSLTDRNALVEVVASNAVLEPGMYEVRRPWLCTSTALTLRALNRCYATDPCHMC